ncbi:hypothetical protein Poly21_07390 [Allorhodopirellula heiligendammensis]|uniref:Uncharacterized protein n=1 Tax=Allorhodopirellula heiligendammensis TaxID=2714739 RepID=A0A5C6C3C4_9BACT|nr:hypothetical protein Poly21_07390 [Allorhodopirellula heiligendammensis]
MSNGAPVPGVTHGFATSSQKGVYSRSRQAECQSHQSKSSITDHREPYGYLVKLVARY